VLAGRDVGDVGFAQLERCVDGVVLRERIAPAGVVGVAAPSWRDPGTVAKNNGGPAEPPLKPADWRCPSADSPVAIRSCRFQPKSLTRSV